MYTSGSTGVPKGVITPHTGIAALSALQRSMLGLGSGSRVLQLVSTSFDTSLWDSFCALLSGATLVLAPRTPLGQDLADFVRDASVTHVAVQPAVVASLPDDSLPAGVTLTLNGDVLPPGLVHRWLPGRRILNGYGPTEATVGAAIWDCAQHEGTGPVPIGRPFDGKRLYVLDELLRRYLPASRASCTSPADWPAATTTGPRSPPSASSPALPGAGPVRRLGRAHVPHGRPRPLEQAGAIEFLGRADDLIKLRGFRIELGEVEAALAAHPDVAQSVAVVREDVPGDRRLVAYSVPEQGRTVDAGALQSWLAQRLPAYLLPSACMVLDALPLNVNDKVDRRALPRPETAASRAGPRATPASSCCATCSPRCCPPARSEPTTASSTWAATASSPSSWSTPRARRACPQHPGPVREPHPGGPRLARPGTGGDRGGPDVGDVPLTPVVHRWRELGGPTGTFHQSVSVPVPAALGLGELTGAVAALLDHHDALRLSLTTGPDWRLRVLAPGSLDARRQVRRVDAIGAHGTALRDLITREAAQARARLAPNAQKCSRPSGSTGAASQADCCSWPTTSPSTECRGASCCPTWPRRGKP
ncbi:AMP-binding protein [Streptomyces sp. M10(2022)]